MSFDTIDITGVWFIPVFRSSNIRYPFSHKYIKSFSLWVLKWSKATLAINKGYVSWECQLTQFLINLVCENDILKIENKVIVSQKAMSGWMSSVSSFLIAHRHTEGNFNASQCAGIHTRDLRIVFFRSNRISNRIGHPIRFRIKSTNRIGRMPRKP